MEKFQRTKTLPEHIRYAVVPKPLLKRFIFLRSMRCAVCVALAFLLVLPLAVLPGLVFLVLPAEIALVGRIQDEAELVLWVRNNMITQAGSWEDAELEAEMIRLRAHDRPSAVHDYLR
ncbi:MAG: hypothetical protein ACXABV_00230 [Candidatus Thorarchaeota archaeon]|jgi:hypothetical protein